MKKTVFVLSLLMSLLLYGKNSSVIFQVTDELGHPISNAVVTVKTFDKYIPGEGFGTSKDKVFKATTDVSGSAVVTFYCKSMDFSYQVTAERYYEEWENRVVFKRKTEKMIEVVQVEFEKRINVIMRERKNPTPMYACGSAMSHKMPEKEGCFPFDMKVCDWVKPYGNGKVCDFYIDIVPLKNGVRMKLIFPNPKDGAYIAMKKQHSFFQTEYCANTNELFLSEFKFQSIETPLGTKDTASVQDNEYLIMRTRTQTDDHGKIIKANYSKLYSCFGFKDFFSCAGYVFNPRVNDINLEFNIKQNLLSLETGILRP